MHQNTVNEPFSTAVLKNCKHRIMGSKFFHFEIIYGDVLKYCYHKCINNFPSHACVHQSSTFTSFLSSQETTHLASASLKLVALVTDDIITQLLQL